MVFVTQRLVADRLTCRRGGRLLFENLSFSVARGSGLALTGPNGVGKTSLLRILAGLLRPESGQVRLEPEGDVSIAEQAHFIGVREGLKSSLTPREHFRFWTECDDDRWRRSPEYVQKVGLGFLVADYMDIPCGWLSTGQRRRVALARLHCAARPIWLLDEPLNGLDAGGAWLLRKIATRYMASGGVIVAASHQPISWPYLTTLPLDVPEPEHSRRESIAP